MSAHGFQQLTVVSTNIKKKNKTHLMQFESLWTGYSCYEDTLWRHWKVVPNWCWHKLFWQAFDSLCKRMSLTLIRVAECKNLQPAVITGHLHLFHVQSVCCFLLGLLFLGMFSFTIWKTPLSRYCVVACPSIPLLCCLVPASVHADTSPEYHSCWCSLGKVLQNPAS